MIFKSTVLQLVDTALDWSDIQVGIYKSGMNQINQYHVDNVQEIHYKKVHPIN